MSHPQTKPRSPGRLPGLPVLSICCSSRKASVERFGERVIALLQGLRSVHGTPLVDRVRYGGGTQGLMGTVYQTVTTLTIPIEGFTLRQWEESGIPDQLFDHLMERQQRVIDADLVLVLPGGVGTAFEWFHAQCEMDIGLRNRTFIIFNPDDWFSPLLTYLKTAEDNGMTRHVDYVLVESGEELRHVLTHFPVSVSVSTGHT